MPPKDDRRRLPRHWKGFLQEVDRALPGGLSLQCLGGFVVEVVYGVTRRTGDIDYIAAAPQDLEHVLDELAGADSRLARKHRVSIQRVAVHDVPEDFESRLIPLKVGLRKLELFVLDPYDLVLSKLTRNQPKDREDVRALAESHKLRFSVLKQRYDREMKPWLPNTERHELTLELWREYFERE
jgi:hypothetical protein